MKYPAPIVTLDKWARSQYPEKVTIGLTSGGFDPIHPGHMSCILESANNCHILVVAVNGDNFIKKKKGVGFMPLDVRSNIVSMITGVAVVVPFEGYDEDDLTCKRPLEVIKPNIFFKGGDRVDKHTIPEWELCEKLGIEVVTGMGEEKKWSSSDFLDDYIRASQKENQSG